MYAAYYCHRKSLVLLIEAGADVNASSKEGITALINATYKGKGRSTVVSKFIEAGADVNMAMEGGITPLMNAAFHVHEES